jgi:hypothetical protein
MALYQLGSHLFRPERINSIDDPEHSTTYSRFVIYVGGRKLLFEENDNMRKIAKGMYDGVLDEEAVEALRQGRRERIDALHGEAVAVFSHVYGNKIGATIDDAPQKQSSNNDSDNNRSPVPTGSTSQ